MDITLFILLSYGALATSLILLIAVIHIEIRLHKFLKGSSGKNLEGLINRLRTREEELTYGLTDLAKTLKRLEKANEQNISKTGFIKFNAFTETGGEQSFSFALLDKEGNGMLLSSIYTRERTSVYAKELTRYSTPSKLLPEERHAIEVAKNKA